MLNTYQQYLDPSRSMLGSGGYDRSLWESSPEAIAMRRQQYESGEWQPRRPGGDSSMGYRDWYRSVTAGINPTIGRINRQMAGGAYNPFGPGRRPPGGRYIDEFGRLGYPPPTSYPPYAFKDRSKFTGAPGSGGPVTYRGEKPFQPGRVDTLPYYGRNPWPQRDYWASQYKRVLY